MIKKLDASDFSGAVDIIRKSFATVAKEFSLTEQNCPRHTSFATTVERLQNQSNWGWYIYGLYDREQLAGYVSISKASEVSEVDNNDNVYEIHNLAVLPEYRHKGYGKQLLNFCREKVKEMGGIKIVISIIEENTVLKNWYAKNGYIHTGTKQFEQFPFTVGYMECLL